MASNMITASLSLVLAVLIALTVRIFYFSPIDPVPLKISPASSASPSVGANEFLNIIKLGDGFVKGPEDISVDKEGTLYTANQDGWIKRLPRNGNWENWKHTDSNTLLGITTSKEGGLIVCDTSKGLLKVTEDGFSVLLSQVNGSQLSFANDAIEASDGSIYFSVTSTKYGPHEWYLDLMDGRPNGLLLKYNPTTNEITVVLRNLYFANGVELSKDEDFVLVCETWKSRCLRYWIKGPNTGGLDTFTEDLPGAPDNINLAPDGSYWIALLQITYEGMEFVQNSKASKRLLAAIPSMGKATTVVNVDIDGNIVRKFDDKEGKVVNRVTSALEFEDNLYVVSNYFDFVGKLPLNSTA